MARAERRCNLVERSGHPARRRVLDRAARRIDPNFLPEDENARVVPPFRTARGAPPFTAVGAPLYNFD